MNAGMVCPHCGHVNTRVGVFCAKCGDKMGVGPVHRDAERTAGKKLKAVLHWIAGLALIGVIGLLFWPQHVPEVSARADTGHAVAQRIAHMRRAAETDTPAADVFRQEDVNAYLAWRLAESAAPGRFTASLERLHVAFDETECALRVLSRLGPIRLSFHLRARPITEENRGRFEVTGAAIGHLPVPKPLVPWVAGKLAHVFTDMEDERMVSSRMRRVESREGQLGVAVGAPQ